jgi:hypothetical protein
MSASETPRRSKRCHLIQALRSWRGDLLNRHGVLRIVHLIAKAEQTDIETGDRFLQRLWKSAPNRHDFANRLHLRTERRISAAKLLEVPARNLDHHVIERRLEAGFGLARDVVLNLVKRVADGDQRRDLGDWEACRLARQRR